MYDNELKLKSRPQACNLCTDATHDFVCYAIAFLHYYQLITPLSLTLIFLQYHFCRSTRSH